MDEMHDMQKEGQERLGKAKKCWWKLYKQLPTGMAGVVISGALAAAGPEARAAGEAPVLHTDGLQDSPNVVYR